MYIYERFLRDLLNHPNSLCVEVLKSDQ